MSFLFIFQLTEQILVGTIFIDSSNVGLPLPARKGMLFNSITCSIASFWFKFKKFCGLFANFTEK
jgi:hypothetical protein